MLRVFFDGNNTAYRCNCVTELYTKSGQRTSAILGVLNTTHSTMVELQDKYNEPVKEVIYVFDKGHSERRTKLFPQYKANRKQDTNTDPEAAKLFKEEFISQINILNNQLHNFGIKTAQIKGWEADDLIYALSDLASVHSDDIIVIVSTDEDFHQLVSENVHLYSPIKKVLYTSKNYKEITGIDQSLFLTYKILKGDSSDGIDGIAGIGEKTGKDLVNKYGNLQGILNNREELMKSKRTEKIFSREGLQILDRNNKLINLKDYVDYSEIKEHLEDLLEEESYVNPKSCMSFLTQYQLSSIIMKFKTFIQPFEELI